MIKHAKLKKPKDQKDLTDLWKSNMNLSNDTLSTPEHSETNKKKKRTPPSTERPKLKRSLLETEEELDQLPSDKEEMEIGENSKITQNRSTEPNKVGSTKVKLTPELLKLHMLLNRDLSKKLDQKLDPLHLSVNEIKTNLVTQENKIEEVMKIRDENIKLQNWCNFIEKENKLLKDRLSVIENHLLENNIILQGINEDSWELNSILREKTIHALSNTIDVKTRQQQIDTMRSMPIKKVQRLGNYNSKWGRPISVAFTYKEDADYVYDNKSNLKKGVYLDREYNEETENNRRILRPILKVARSKEEYKKKCKMEGDNLIIKGKTYTVENLSSLPEDINGYNATSKSDDTSLGFFGELNPMSNFHRCSFTVDNIKYHSAEQFIQNAKAVFFNDKNDWSENSGC